MAIVVIGRNGIGLGHQARMAALCASLRTHGQTPVLLRQGRVHQAIYGPFPISYCPYFNELTQAERELWQTNLEAYAHLSNPSVVIEDTHPTGIQYSDDIRKVLVVRPLTFVPMMNLLKSAEARFDYYLVADEPHSPTWPYTPVETSLIKSTPGVSIIGPLFRSPPLNDIREVRRRYGYRRGEDICVFSMGGGGNHYGTEDAVHFVREATTAGQLLKEFDRNARLVLVKGPLFPEKVTIPPIFEIVDSEPQMPALLRLARAAMIRLGFNSVWESIAGFTPIVPFLGTSYQEPMDLRLASLIRNGFAFTDIEAAWDAGKFAGRKTQAGRLGTRWTGRPKSSVVNLICGPMTRVIRTVVKSRVHSQHSNDSPQASEQEIWTVNSDNADEPSAQFVQIGTNSSVAKTTVVLPTARFSQRPSGNSFLQAQLSDFVIKAIETSGNSIGRSPFGSFHKHPDIIVRIDDVIELHDGLERFIHFATEHRIPLTLEIIPLHCKIREESLRSLGLTESNVELSQHGYSHLPFEGFSGECAEFDPYAPRPTFSELDSLRAGKTTLQQRFGSLFCGGYSAPFDRFSPWLAEAWYQMDGQFLSFIWNRPNGARIKSVRVPVDVWNWNARRPRAIGDIIRGLCRSATRNGYTGLVLHQQHFHNEEYLHLISRLLIVMLGAGFRPVPLSAHALLHASRTTTSVYRTYNREAVASK
jgi:hypothetical protein